LLRYLSEFRLNVSSSRLLETRESNHLGAQGTFNPSAHSCLSQVNTKQKLVESADRANPEKRSQMVKTQETYVKRLEVYKYK